jgi:hypothetical protein
MLRVLPPLALLMALSACSSGLSLDPTDWFGPKEDITLVSVVPEGGFPSDVDPRDAIAQVTELKVEQTSGGVIIRVKGVPPTLGYWEAELVPENGEKPDGGVLTYTFRIAPPLWASAQSSVRAREVYVAQFVSDAKLAGVSRIRVDGGRNTLTARR